MTLDEAIKHVSRLSRLDYKQLTEWLCELKELRKLFGNSETLYRETATATAQIRDLIRDCDKEQKDSYRSNSTR